MNEMTDYYGQPELAQIDAQIDERAEATVDLDDEDVDAALDERDDDTDY